MAGFLVDEDLPRSLAPRLRTAGLAAQDVRDVGLRGGSDDNVLAHAAANGLALVTGDLGFANVVRYPLGSHRGIIVARFPTEIAAVVLTRGIVEALGTLSGSDVEGNLVILEPGRLRIRRKPTTGPG